MNINLQAEYIEACDDVLRLSMEARRLKELISRAASAMEHMGDHASSKYSYLVVELREAANE